MIADFKKATLCNMSIADIADQGAALPMRLKPEWPGRQPRQLLVNTRLCKRFIIPSLNRDADRGRLTDQ